MQNLAQQDNLSMHTGTLEYAIPNLQTLLQWILNGGLQWRKTGVKEKETGLLFKNTPENTHTNRCEV